MASMIHVFHYPCTKRSPRFSACTPNVHNCFEIVSFNSQFIYPATVVVSGTSLVKLLASFLVAIMDSSLAMRIKLLVSHVDILCWYHGFSPCAPCCPLSLKRFCFRIIVVFSVLSLGHVRTFLSIGSPAVLTRKVTSLYQCIILT